MAEAEATTGGADPGRFLDRVHTEFGRRLMLVADALPAARTDFERLMLRDEARALAAAAAVLNRRDIQVEASIIVSDAERAIAKANPAAQGKRTDLEANFGHGASEVPETQISKAVVKHLRQTHGDLSDAQYADLKRQAIERRQPLTQRAVKSVVRAKRRTERVTSHRESLTPQALPRLKFGLILADPPWRYDQAPTQDDRVDQKYPTMSDQQICDVAVSSLCAASCVLYLWATAAKLPAALRAMRAWGFSYKTHMVWVKPSVGMGFWVRARHELLLVGVHGDFPPPAFGTQPDSVIEAPRGRHSEKPAAVHEMLGKLYPNVARVELFARARRAGWQVWGNEVCAFR